MAVETGSPTQTSRHLWIVAIGTLIWNGFGALDYTLTQMRVEAYMSQFTPEQLDYFYGFPVWADAAWALGVWGAVVGSAALLVRRSWAQWAFAVSLVGLVGTTLYTLVLTDGPAVMGGAATLVFSLLIWVVTVGLFVYSRTMAHRGVLR
jgi:hypothetical protein